MLQALHDRCSPRPRWRAPDAGPQPCAGRRAGGHRAAAPACRAPHRAAAPGLAGPAAAAAAAGLCRHAGRAAGLGRGRRGAGGAADLTLRFDASNPARLLAARALAGETPAVDIDGDAQLAADVNWLMQNLRWDVEADLERRARPGRWRTSCTACGVGAGARRRARPLQGAGAALRAATGAADARCAARAADARVALMRTSRG